MAHNGNLTNPDELRDIMRQTHRHINTDSDSELLLNVLAEELQRKRLEPKLAPDEIFATVRALMKRCKGWQFNCIYLQCYVHDCSCSFDHENFMNIFRCIWLCGIDQRRGFVGF